MAVAMMEDGTGKKGESGRPAEADRAFGRFMRMYCQVRVDGFVLEAERIAADCGSWLGRLSSPPFVRSMAFGVFVRFVMHTDGGLVVCGMCNFDTMAFID
jgi:hypothetical protein